MTEPANPSDVVGGAEPVVSEDLETKKSGIDGAEDRGGGGAGVERVYLGGGA